MSEDIPEWLKTENLRRQEAAEKERVDRGVYDGSGDFGSYYAYLKGTNRDFIKAHALSEEGDGRAYARVLEDGLSRLGVGLRGEILDVGCGIGTITGALAALNAGGRTAGLDISESGIAVARRRYPACEFYCRAADELGDFKDGTLDLIHAREFYPFTRTNNLAFQLKHLRLFFSKLKPGGALVLAARESGLGFAASLPRLEGEIRRIGYTSVEAAEMMPLKVARLYARLPRSLWFHAFLTVTGGLAARAAGVPRHSFYLLRKEGQAFVPTVYAPPRARRPWQLGNLLGAQVRYYSLARFALAEALRLAGVRPQDSVLVPGLICREVLFALEAVRARPLFYAVNERLEPADDPMGLPDSRAIIAVNYFGFPQNLDGLARYAKKRGSTLIEDNAHGLFSRDEQGAWLGVRADLGVFSLRKTIPLAGGGALALPLGGRFPPPPQIEFLGSGGLRHQVKRGLRLSVPALGLGPVRALTRLARAVKPASQGESAQPSPHPCAELSRPITLADPKEELLRRQGLYRFSEQLIVQAGGKPVFDRLPPLVSPYGFPFYCEDQNLPRVRQVLDRAGLDMFRWPDLPADVLVAPSIVGTSGLPPRPADVLVAPSIVGTSGLPPRQEALREIPAHYRTLWCVRFLW